LRLCLFIALAIASQAALGDFSGPVVKVQDGDTLTVLVASAEVRVRLDGIDAPEMKQPYGRRSRESLANLCAAKQAQVVEQGRDRYGRTIGRVWCGGLSANAEQVRRGMAWVFVRYAPAGSPLYAMERDARGRREGLWADGQPTAPWEWRRLHPKQPRSG
jgi:endonuclease YncB( thermonuclease family)